MGESFMYVLAQVSLPAVALLTCASTLIDMLFVMLRLANCWLQAVPTAAAAPRCGGPAKGLLRDTPAAFGRGFFELRQCWRRVQRGQKYRHFRVLL